MHSMYNHKIWGASWQASNKLGESEWSEEARFRTHATVPDQPEAPRLVSAGPTRVVLHWDAPADNGAPIENYLLERGEGWALALHNCMHGPVKVLGMPVSPLQQQC